MCIYGAQTNGCGFFNNIFLATSHTRVPYPGIDPNMPETANSENRTRGIIATAVFGTASAFCWAQYLRAGHEEAKIKDLFRHHTTIRDLERIAAAGKPLPPLAVICGRLGADNEMLNWPGTSVKQYLLTRNSVTVYGPGWRAPKKTRYTVATSRRVAPGLHLRELSGGEASVRLPSLQTDMGQNSPCLFGSHLDAIQDFITSTELRNKLAESAGFGDLSKTPLAQTGRSPTCELSRCIGKLIHVAKHFTGKRLMHTSKFVTSDLEPSGDLPRDFLVDCNAKLSALDRPDNTPGPMAKSYWFWNPRGFYDGSPRDNAPPAWCTFPRCEYVLASEFVRRAEIAARENSTRGQDIDVSASTAWGKLRDSEFGFRFVELTIPTDADVTIVARPVLVSDDPSVARRLKLCEPLKDVEGSSFR